MEEQDGEGPEREIEERGKRRVRKRGERRMEEMGREGGRGRWESILISIIDGISLMSWDSFPPNKFLNSRT